LLRRLLRAPSPGWFRWRFRGLLALRRGVGNGLWRRILRRRRIGGSRGPLRPGGGRPGAAGGRLRSGGRHLRSGGKGLGRGIWRLWRGDTRLARCGRPVGRTTARPRRAAVPAATT
jgi:hypothetical protein